MNPKKNLHLCKDDKFIDSFIRNLEQIDNINNHYFISYNQRGEGKFKSITSKYVKFVPLTKIFSFSFLNQFRNIFIHNLSIEITDIVSFILPSQKLFWVFFGADFYSVSQKEQFCPLTRSFLYNEGLKKYIPNYILKLRNNRFKESNKKKKKKIIERADYILHYNRFELDLIKQEFNIKAKYIDFIYGMTGELFSSNASFSDSILYDLFGIEKGNSLLIGNSGNPTNNHLEIFQKLILNNQFKTYNVIVPLSYGSKGYINFILKEGKRLFGHRFFPILDFLNREDYFSLLHSIDIAIFNHKRGQGAGNILPLLLYEKTVFLNFGNPLYYLLKQYNIFVKRIDDLDCKNDIAINSQNKGNSSIVFSNFFEKKSINYMENIIRIANL